MTIYRIYCIPNIDLTGTCVGVVVNSDALNPSFKVVATTIGPSYNYDENKIEINLTPEIIETFPDNEQETFKKSMKITIMTKDNLLNRTIEDCPGVIQYDVPKEKFCNFFKIN